MGGVLSLAVKDLRLLFRDRWAMFWVIGFPLVYGIFFGFIMSGIGGSPRGQMRVAVVDEDRSAGSQAYLARLASSEAVTLVAMASPEARDAVRRGNATAMIGLRPGFGETMGLFGSDALEIGLDPSRRAESGMLQGVLMETAFRVMHERWTDPAELRSGLRDWRSELASSEDVAPHTRLVLTTFLDAAALFADQASGELLGGGEMQMGGSIRTVSITRDQVHPRSAFEITFPSSMMWAIIGCVTGFAVSIVKERRSGTFLRLQVSPLSRTHLLAGKGLACLAMCLGVLVFLAVLGRLGFGVRVSNPVALMLSVVCIAVGFTGVMMLMSVIGRSEEAVAGMSTAFLMLAAMLGGGMIPLIVMPGWMQTVSDVSPIKWAILALEGAIWRDFSLREMVLPCGILLAVGAVCFAVGVRKMPRVGT
jgi:ABC-2 type transport system permease protein